MRNLSLTLAACSILLGASACSDDASQQVFFTPDPWDAPGALPGFTSSGSVTLSNTTGTTYALTAFSITGGGDDGDDALRFAAVLPDDVALPLDLPPGGAIDFTVVFSPEDLNSYETVLTASLSLSDFVVGGGGCSAGCGSEAPEDGVVFATAVLRGEGSPDASFEDCTDREDNDDDGLIDCDDPDCATHPNCVSDEDCDDEVDNDDDGAIDCDDEDCALDPACLDPDDEDCSDGIDNDGDGEVDCDDSDCALDPLCDLRGCTPVGEIGCQSEVAGNTENSDNNWQRYCGGGPGGGGPDGWTGPEDIWAFVPDQDGPVTVAAGGEWDLDLTILEASQRDDGFVCDPDECVATSWNPPDQEIEEAEFFAEAGVLYLIVIDGWDDHEGEYFLDVTCNSTGDTETDCDDEVDNDGDGRVDCDDSDCEGSPDCAPDALCQIVDQISCGDSVTASNDMVGSTDAIDSWCGDPNDGFTGPEVAFIFFNQGPPTEVTVTLNGLTDDLDLMLLEAQLDGTPPPDCNPDLCLETGWSPGTEPEQVTFVTQPGQAYILAVDGWDGAVSPFTLTIDCGGGPSDPEICDDGIDNDGDGSIDCDDLEDCNAFPACDYGDGDCCTDNGTPGCDNETGEDCVCAADAFCCEASWDFICAGLFENQCGGTCGGPGPDPEVCDNLVDDDGDGLVDCDDADCFGDPNCAIPGTEISCTNGVDDDLDGATDCDDPDCAADPACTTVPTEICDNGIDDDSDGLFDCADPDCAADPNCQPPVPETDCANNLDDDGDGLFDCADPDCAGDPNCNLPGTETNCANSADDDGDGAIDCDDTDCIFDPNCNVSTFESDCFDGLDNDADGDTDCDDSDCAALPGCTNPAETDCTNGIDDDADGWTDCNDSDCAFDPGCANGEFSCTDGVDNDGDGDIDCDDSDCSADVACVDPGSCDPLGNLSCGDVISGSNTMAGSADDIEQYCGYNPGGWFGEEVSWVFTPDFDGVVEIALSGLSEDLDIQAVVDTGSGCDPDDCEANGWNPPPDPESMDWFAFAGTPYYVVIDGWQGASSSFTMTVTCTPADESDCGDGIDNDLDGDLDCADIDCLGNPACPEADCTDGVDNDADGHIDCDDPDCSSAPTCIPELNCVDGADNDGDGAIDCDDSDCAGATSCLPETACDDGIDNDGDGDTDCVDSDCNTDPSCGLCYPTTQVLGCGDVYFGDNSSGTAELDEYCGTGAGTFPGPEDYFVITPTVSATVTVSLFGLSGDLDVIALIDDPAGGCAPGNCAAYDPAVGNSPEDIDFPAAAGSSTFVAVDGWGGATSAYGLAVICNAGSGPEVCDDGFDNDGDGDEDCFDSDCLGDIACNSEWDCADGFDNDADGLADCNDSDCFGEPGCPVILFSSVDDDPFDFITSPLGTNSSATDWEQGEPDTASQGGNGPSTAFEGTDAWCTGCDSVAVSGGRFSSTLVAAPLIFDLTPYSGGTLSLSWHYWQTSPTPPFIDLFRLTTSNDGGANWGITWGPNAASTNGWTFVEEDLTGFLGGPLSFGFWYDSLTGFGGGGADGLYIDNVELIYTP